MRKYSVGFFIRFDRFGLDDSASVFRDRSVKLYYEIEAKNLAEARAVMEQFVPSGYDLRYWNFEIFAYAVGSEDFQRRGELRLTRRQAA